MVDGRVNLANGSNHNLSILDYGGIHRLIDGHNYGVSHHG